MQKKSHLAIVYVAKAHRRAFQLRRTLACLLQTLDEKDIGWTDLAHDADCMERRLRGALNTMTEVLAQDPAGYTPLPRPD